MDLDMGDDEEGNPFKIETECDLPLLQQSIYELDVTINFLKDRVEPR
jgi:hypothetical protein